MNGNTGGNDHTSDIGKLDASQGAFEVEEGARRWAAAGDAYWTANKTYDSLPAGVYSCGSSDSTGPFLRKMIAETDDLIEMPDSAGAKVIEEFIRFSGMEEVFKKLGFVHKRGTLLWGPPGSGKTCLLNQMSRIIREKYNGIVVYIEKPNLGAACLEMIRKTEPTRPILVLLEDFEEMVRINGEASFLSLLDGETQISNVMFVATTNYPEKLDKRFTNRPSRFDRIVYIGMPKAKLRREFLRRKLVNCPLSEDELDRWVSLTKGYSMAHMREVIVSVLGFGYDLDETVERLNKLREGNPNSDNQPTSGSGRRQVGFVFTAPDEDDEE